MRILIVHAHHEPKSFSSALARHAREVFEPQGHTVDFTNLYAERFNPVSDRRNFTTVLNPDYLKQQLEEAHASEAGGFAADAEREIARLEACDLLVFNFPLWWFGLPAILKGWADRVLVAGRVYGGPRLYENGLGQSRKRAMVVMTTGGGPEAYGGRGVNPPLEAILAPIQHGIFWFNGFLPLAPFVAWSPARTTAEQRSVYLESLEARLAGDGAEPPQILPPLRDFPGWGTDVEKRFMVTVARVKPVDEEFRSRVSAEGLRLAELKRDGLLLSSHFSPPRADPWRGFLFFRAKDASAVQSQLDTLPLAPWMGFEIAEVD